MLVEAQDDTSDAATLHLMTLCLFLLPFVYQ